MIDRLFNFFSGLLRTRNAWNLQLKKFTYSKYILNLLYIRYWINVSTPEEFLKCRLYLFSVGYAADNYMIWRMNYEAVGLHASSTSGIFIYLHKNIFLKTFILYKNFVFWVWHRNVYYVLVNYKYPYQASGRKIWQPRKIKLDSFKFKTTLYVFFHCIHSNEFNCTFKDICF